MMKGVCYWCKCMYKTQNSFETKPIISLLQSPITCKWKNKTSYDLFQHPQRKYLRREARPPLPAAAAARGTCQRRRLRYWSSERGGSWRGGRVGGCTAYSLTGTLLNLREGGSVVTNLTSQKKTLLKHARFIFIILLKPRPHSLTFWRSYICRGRLSDRF